MLAKQMQCPYSTKNKSPPIAALIWFALIAGNGVACEDWSRLLQRKEKSIQQNLCSLATDPSTQYCSSYFSTSLIIHNELYSYRQILGGFGSLVTTVPVYVYRYQYYKATPSNSARAHAFAGDFNYLQLCC